MDDVTMGWVGGIGGSLIGLAGGAFGTWAALRAARTADERRRVWGFALLVLLLVAGLLAGLFLLPKPYNWLVWIPYPFALTKLILAYNRREAEPRATGL